MLFGVAADLEEALEAHSLVRAAAMVAHMFAGIVVTLVLVQVGTQVLGGKVKPVLVLFPDKQARAAAVAVVALVFFALAHLAAAAVLAFWGKALTVLVGHVVLHKEKVARAVALR